MSWVDDWVRKSWSQQKTYIRKRNTRQVLTLSEHSIKFYFLIEVEIESWDDDVVDEVEQDCCQYDEHCSWSLCVRMSHLCQFVHDLPECQHNADHEQQDYVDQNGVPGLWEQLIVDDVHAPCQYKIGDGDADHKVDQREDSRFQFLFLNCSHVVPNNLFWRRALLTKHSIGLLIQEHRFHLLQKTGMVFAENLSFSLNRVQKHNHSIPFDIEIGQLLIAFLIYLI